MIKPGFYRHYKGGIYYVIGLAINDSDSTTLVVYSSVQGCAEDPPMLRTRTLEDFTETFARFARVEKWG